jgi:heptosyltransferase-2
MSRPDPNFPPLNRPARPRTELGGRTYLDSLRPDCRHFNGYKPCRHQFTCVDCADYRPRGRRIAMVKLGAMGDVLRTTSLLGGMRRSYPDGFTLTWITERASLPLLRHHPDIHEVVTIEEHGSLLGLDGRPFDEVWCLDKEPEALGVAARLNAPRKLGFAHDPRGGLGVSNDASWYALKLGLDDPLKFRHNTKTYPEIIYEMVELEYRADDYELAIGPDAVRASEQWSEVWGAQGKGGPIVGVNPGAGWRFPTKRWPDTVVLDFAIAVAETIPGASVALLGGKVEEERNAELVTRGAGRLLATPTNLPLEEFIGLVASLDALVSTDSLALHIGIGLKLPVVGLFGSTSAVELELFGRGTKIVSDFECAPCYMKTCPQPVFCMDHLQGARAAEAIADLLDKDHARTLPMERPAVP